LLESPAGVTSVVGDRVGAVLHEVAQALQALARNPRRSRAIDLNSLPLDDAERAALRTRLGQGEVQASVQAAGETRVDETAFAGVWWVEHAGADGRPLQAQIVVARVPPLLPAHRDDIAAAAGRLGAAWAAAEAPGVRDG
jgi:hydrogenase-1 operon protein HyaF